MKNFITSSTQRNYVLGSIVAAFVFSFFPAVTLPFVGSLAFTAGAYGKIMIFVLVLSLCLLFFQNEIQKFIETNFKKQISDNIFVFVITTLLSGVLIYALYLWQAATFVGSPDNPFAKTFASVIGAEFGLYLVIFSIIFAFANIFTFAKVENGIAFITKKFSEQKSSNISQISSEKTEADTEGKK